MKIQIISLFLYMSVAINAQNIPSTNDPYFESLKIYIESLIEIEVLNKGDTILVSQRDYISNYDGKYEEVYIKMLSNEMLHRLTKKGSAVRVIVLNPLEFINGHLFITTVNFGVTRKRRHYTLINNGHNKIKLAFDCNIGDYSYEVIDSH